MKTKMNTKKKGNNNIRDKLHEFKREQILEVAGELFYERGYHSTTVDAIAERLSVTKPFIYYHFKNKLDILQCLLERTISTSLHVFDDIDIENDRPTEALRELIHGFVLNVIENQTLIAMFWRDEKDLPVKNRDNIRKIKKGFDTRLSRILARGTEGREFDVPDIKIASLAIAGMITWTYTWYREDRRLAPETIAGQLTEMVLSMVTSRQSGKTGKEIQKGSAVVLSGA